MPIRIPNDLPAAPILRQEGLVVRVSQQKHPQSRCEEDDVNLSLHRPLELVTRD